MNAPVYRTGIGIDYHRLSSERPLILCGIKVEHALGLEGHSDADVATHAVIDALLGAASLGDIGEHFPQTNMKYKNMSSMRLLGMTVDKLKENNYEVINIDIDILAEAPQIHPYKKEMIKTLAKHLKIDESCVNVKGKTTEGMGPIGRQEGISAYSVCLVKKLTENH